MPRTQKPTPHTPPRAADTDPVIARITQDLHARILTLRAELSQLERAMAALTHTPTPDTLPHRATATTKEKRTVRQARTSTRKSTRKARKPRVNGAHSIVAKHYGEGRPPGSGQFGQRVLRDYVADVLRDQPHGLTSQEITDRVIAAGWQTVSKNPKSVLYQELSGGKRSREWYKHDGHGNWLLKKDPRPLLPTPVQEA